MKISICSDFHLEYGWDSERREDSFRNAKEAIKKSIDSDMILLPGDLFDVRIPRQEVLSKAADIFSIPLTDSDSELEIVETDMEKEVSELNLRGVPMVAIHGTHERRSKSFVNPIQLLERIGYLIHLHGNYVVFKNKEGDKIAVHGLSGVPERYARDALEKMDPKPIEGAYNVLMLHQSIGEYVYSRERDSILKVEDLPEGFDLIIDGHIHWYNLEDKEKNKNLIFPGSTITTQMRKVESERSKGILELDTKNSDLNFKELNSPREVFYIEVEVSGMSSQEARKKIKERLEEALGKNSGKKPLIRLSIEGKDPLRISKNKIKQNFKERAILSIKKDFDTSSDREKAFKEFESERKSVEKVGKEILADRIENIEEFNKKLNFDLENFFEVLAEGEKEKGMKILKEGIKMKKEKEEGEKESDRNNLNKFLK